jgi:DNA polymerase III delta prime subunit
MPVNRLSVSELLRPRQLGDLMLPQRDINHLQRMIDTDNVMDMLFYGRPGVGKTSAAWLIKQGWAHRVPDEGDDLGFSGFREFNGSLVANIAFVRETIEPFAHNSSFFGGRKLCFIDEADYMSKRVQGALRRVIEDNSSRCAFLLAVNDRPKIIEPLQSRLFPICFDIRSSDRPQVRDRLLRRYRDVLTENGIQFNEQRLIQLIWFYYPDLRRIATGVRYEFAYEVQVA